MAEAVVQLPLDGVGKKIRAIELVVGANTVYMEGNVPYDEDGVGLYDAVPVVGAGRQALIDTVGLEGEHTNPEKYRADNHWQTPAEIPIIAAGGPGELPLGAVVPAGYQRRIMYLKLRHTGTANTIVSLTESVGVTTLDSWDVPAQTTRVVSVQVGWRFDAAEQPAVQTSDITGGGTFVTAIGLEEET